ncbi:hypothetical protein HY58_07000 [Flavihumibacter sp. ZG627]|nr:hypothetical protein HY58_07000 [Flavihumibacter sp. ZG627]
MRIYDPRIGKFLSVDPLTKGYPMLTPYQFASNRPIDGFDLDGLEYLNSNFARVEVVNGIVKLKMANMHNITRNTFQAANNDPNNWITGQIGINNQIGHIDYKSFVPNPVKNEFDNDPTHEPNKIQIIGLALRHKSVLPEGFFAGGEMLPKAPIENTRLGKAGIILDAFITGESFLRTSLNNDDFNTALQQTKYLKMATYDVSQALVAKKSPIPEEYRTPALLSDITNVVLSGVSNLNNKEVLKIGTIIYNEFSMKRKPYDGTLRITDQDGRVIMQAPKLNKKYDPNYGKEGDK